MTVTNGNASIVVVTGLPRSGTSMMMRMLEAGGMPLVVDGIRKADLDNPNGYYEYEPVKALSQDSSWVHAARGKAVKMVYLLLYDLPRDLPYDVIFMHRDLEEVVDSQDEMLRRNGTRISPPESRHLIGMFRGELRSVEEWLNARKNFRVLRVQYSQTIEDPVSTCAAVKAFLGLHLDEARMQSVVTRSLHRQRRTVAR
jgi:Sulfotransferase domain